MDNGALVDWYGCPAMDSLTFPSPYRQTGPVKNVKTKRSQRGHFGACCGDLWLPVCCVWQCVAQSVVNHDELGPGLTAGILGPSIVSLNMNKSSSYIRPRCGKFLIH
jgi:hypothetical protein